MSEGVRRRIDVVLSGFRTTHPPMLYPARLIGAHVMAREPADTDLLVEFRFAGVLHAKPGAAALVVGILQVRAGSQLPAHG